MVTIAERKYTQTKWMPHCDQYGRQYVDQFGYLMYYPITETFIERVTSYQPPNVTIQNTYNTINVVQPPRRGGVGRFIGNVIGGLLD